ncbi:MAG: DNA-binding protein [Desulfobulbaceae bacterium]|nr:DNA-binding protein [Desulfobulbaceae bacterium]
MRKKMMYFACGMALTLSLVGCGNKDKNAETAAPADQATAAPAETSAAPTMVTGTVKETMSGGGFTYVLLESAGGAPTWYAMPETKMAAGDSITLQAGSTFPNFYSKALDRTFESLIFSQGLAGATADANPHAMGAMHGGATASADAAPNAAFADAVKAEGKVGSTLLDPNLVSPGSVKAVVPFASLKVTKATGNNAHTVSSIFAEANKLNGKKVRVRGQVMKVSRMIMGKNWIHLQDGTGEPTKNTHDLVVTTMAEPAAGDTVTVEGVLSANKDFGAGYHYDAIVEDATVGK